MVDEPNQMVTRAAKALVALAESPMWPTIEAVGDRRLAVVERLVASRCAGARVLDLDSGEEDPIGFERLGAASVVRVATPEALDAIRSGPAAEDGWDLVHFRAEDGLALDSDALPVLRDVAGLLGDAGAMVLTSLAWTRGGQISRTTWRDGSLEWQHGAQVVRWMIEAAGFSVLECVDDAGVVGDRPETARIAVLACRR